MKQEPSYSLHLIDDDGETIWTKHYAQLLNAQRAKTAMWIAEQPRPGVSHVELYELPRTEDFD